MAGLIDTIRISFGHPRWLDVRYLLISFITGIFGFTLLLSAFSTATGLTFVLIGLPIAVLVAHGARWWCEMERGRAGRVLGRAVVGRYVAPSGAGRISRRLSVLRDRQTWLDGLWIVVALPLGLFGFVFAIAVVAAIAGLVSAPIWLWSIPGWIHHNVIALSIGFPLLALPASTVGGWLVRGAAVGHARAAESILGVDRAEVLEQRVQTLSETRAGAVDAAVSELQRVERDLHDGAQARLVALAMDLGLAEQRLATDDHAAAMEHVAAARGQARAAMAELRDLVRGIGPSILTDRGLDAALTALVAGENPPVALRVELTGTAVTARETAAYFVVAEAIANVRKHASATHVDVQVTELAEQLIIEVTDDGVGGADPGAGSGLAGLSKRVAALDGTLTLVSPSGGPTTLRAVI